MRGRPFACGLCLAAALAAGGAQACRVAPQMDAVPGSMADLPSEDDAALTAAWYEALRPFPHGVLGDGLEPTRLHAISGATSASCGVSVEAGEGQVFEDVAPRLADVDGDGRPEVVAVRSSRTSGAQLVVYGLRDGALRPVAQTPPIGRPNRWLAPAAIADLDGDGAVEIAYVDRPHLARTLRVWRVSEGGLREVASLAGVSNHRIGEAFISGGLRDCGAGPEIVLAAGDWTRMLAVTFDGGALAARDLGPWSAEGARAALACGR